MATSIPASPIPVLVLTGPVGVGKSTVAEEISDILRARRIAHALVDMDYLRRCYPRPEGDPHHTALGLRNLAAVWANYKEAGAERLIIVDIVETRLSIAGYRSAVPGADILVVRLNASLPAIHRRLEGRDTGESLRWHLHRAGELLRHWQEQPVEDLLIETEGKEVGDVAREVLARTGWAAPDTGHQ
jgi:hypothetical protein